MQVCLRSPPLPPDQVRSLPPPPEAGVARLHGGARGRSVRQAHGGHVVVVEGYERQQVISL